MKATAFLLVALAFIAQPALAQSSSNPLDTRIFKNGLWFGAGSTCAGRQQGTAVRADQGDGGGLELQGTHPRHHQGVEVQESGDRMWQPLRSSTCRSQAWGFRRSP